MKFKFSDIETKYKLSDKFVLNPKDQPCIKAKVQKKIRLGVIIGHVALLCSPFIFAFWAWLFAEKEIEIMSVSLVLPSQHQAPIDINATKAADKPAPKKKSKPKPKPKPKPAPKPKPKPIPKTTSKVVPKKNTVETPKNWERTSVKDLEEEASESVTNPPPAKVIGKRPVMGNPNATPSENAMYLAQLKAELDPEFEKLRPSRFDIGGGNPENTVEISIDQQGNIVSCKFLKISGVIAMDESVRKLFQIKRRVLKKDKGPFPFTTTITFALD